jgi:hypothetical protein
MGTACAELFDRAHRNRYLLPTSELGEALEVVVLNRAGEVGKARRKVL